MSITKIPVDPIRPAAGPLAKMVGASALSQINQLKTGSGQSLEQVQSISGEASAALQDQINAINTLLKLAGNLDLDSATINTIIAAYIAAIGMTGTGLFVLQTSPTLITPALGTPASVTLTNATGLPIGTGVSGLGANVGTFLGTPSSANLAAALTDETGSGAAVFGTSPTIVTPTIASFTNSQHTHADAAGGGTLTPSFTSLTSLLENGWSDFGTGYKAPGYTKDVMGYVQVVGELTGGTATDATRLFILPAGYRPTAAINLAIPAYDGAFKPAQLLVKANGDVELYGLTTATIISITIRFPTF